MAKFASKNVLVAAGHEKALDALYAHFNHADAATHWDVIDADAGVAGGAAVITDYFVARSKHATVPMDLKFMAEADGLKVDAGWKGGWAGVGGDDAGWGGNPATGLKVIYNDGAALLEAWVITDVGKATILFDQDRDGTVNLCCLAAPYTAFEDATVDAWPSFMMAGYPNTTHADSILDGDHAWTLGHDGTTTVDVQNGSAYTYPVSASRFSGLEIPMPFVLDVKTPAFTGIRGTTDLMQYVPDRADKDTLGGKDKIIFNDLAFDWDGSVPV